MSEYLDRVLQATTSTGDTGTYIQLTPDSFNSLSNTMDQAGAIDGKRYSYVIEDNGNYEIQDEQLYDATNKRLGRGTPTLSKISNIPGTSKIPLSGSAVISQVASAKSLIKIRKDARRAAIIFG